MGNPTKTFRVRRVPANLSRSTLAGFLQRSVSALGGDTNICVRSLASSPDDWNSPPSQTATLEFVDLPPQFQSKAATTWEFPVPGHDIALTFDTDFIGFTPLNQVDEQHHEFEYVRFPILTSLFRKL